MQVTPSNPLSAQLQVAVSFSMSCGSPRNRATACGGGGEETACAGGEGTACAGGEGTKVLATRSSFISGNPVCQGMASRHQRMLCTVME